MNFTSFHFLLFFPAVCILYYLIPQRYKWQYLLVVSYLFYINWQPIYAVLLFATTVVTYAGARLIEKTEEKPVRRKSIFIASCVIPISILVFYKYYNFVNGAVFDLLDRVGLRWPFPEIKLLLPIGISFYTFMAVGYVVDVYRRTIPAERNLGLYALFVSFFPQVTAGPIGRANSLISQLRNPSPDIRENIMEGLKQMMWGYFMKLCIADRLASYVDAVYGNLPQHNGSTLLLASVFYTVQIYCDFAGYSLIAIGAARMMGIRLMENFRRPYFAKNVKEFWSRWHISLSTWFRDYVYIPLGGNRVSKSRHMGNLMLTFLVSGLWHGANWTFILWGGMHGLLQVIETLWRRRTKLQFIRGGVPSFVKIFFTFMLVNFAWIFFRSPDIKTGWGIISKIFTSRGSLFVEKESLILGCLSLLLLIAKDVADEYEIGFDLLSSKRLIISNLSMVLLISYILLFGVLDSGQFIYFQF